MAKKVGAHAAFISNVERGRTAPGRELLFKLAAALSKSPEFIESGKPTEQEQLDRAIRILLPETVYTLVHQIIVPQLRPIDQLFQKSRRLERLVQAAQDAIHFCEFCQRLGSHKPTSTTRSDDPAESGLFDEIRRVSQPCVFMPPLEESEKIVRRFSRSESAPRVHGSAWGRHATTHPLNCFEFDFTVSMRAYNTFVPAHARGELYSDTFYSDPFVRLMFPSLLWSAANTWSNRRLAAWFWYLGLPLQVLGPLSRMARQYEDHKAFAASAAPFLTRLPAAACDRFLGYFRCFLIGGILPLPYDGRTDGTPDIPLRESLEGLAPVVARSLRRETALPKALVDLVFLQGTDEQKSQLLAHLTEIAPPHELKQLRGVPVLQPGRSSEQAACRDDPRLRESPPDTLP